MAVVAMVATAAMVDTQVTATVDTVVTATVDTQVTVTNQDLYLLPMVNGALIQIDLKSLPKMVFLPFLESTTQDSEVTQATAVMSDPSTAATVDTTVDTDTVDTDTTVKHNTWDPSMELEPLEDTVVHMSDPSMELEPLEDTVVMSDPSMEDTDTVDTDTVLMVSTADMVVSTVDMVLMVSTV